MRKEIDLGELSSLVAEGPAGREKIDKQRRAIQDLSESLALMARRQRPYEVPISTDGNCLRFGLTGDTHIGSLYQRTDALKAFYLHCEREGVTEILNVGDVIDGMKVYAGQEYELHPNGRSWPEQRAMFADLVPRVKGITTHFITGNHDNSFKRLIGMIVGEELSAVRPDWKFVGSDVGTVTLKTKEGQRFNVMMLHPDGGTAYAISYRLQKIIETIPGGQKPDMLAIGHFHKSEYLPAYRNVSGFQVGCFQAITPFMTRKSSAAHVGGWLIEVVLNERKKLTSRVKAEFIAFFEEQR